MAIFWLYWSPSEEELYRVGKNVAMLKMLQNT